MNAHNCFLEPTLLWTWSGGYEYFETLQFPQYDIRVDTACKSYIRYGLHEKRSQIFMEIPNFSADAPHKSRNHSWTDPQPTTFQECVTELSHRVTSIHRGRTGCGSYDCMEWKGLNHEKINHALTNLNKNITAYMLNRYTRFSAQQLFWLSLL